MNTLQEAEKLLSVMTRAEKAQLLQWVARDLGGCLSRRREHCRRLWWGPVPRPYPDSSLGVGAIPAPGSERSGFAPGLSDTAR